MARTGFIQNECMARTGFIQNELDLKLLVLYIMSRTAAPVTFNQLLDVALCDAGVDYFSLTEVVGHLVETGHLEQTGQVYAITEKGRRNSEICESSLPRRGWSPIRTAPAPCACFLPTTAAR